MAETKKLSGVPELDRSKLISNGQPKQKIDKDMKYITPVKPQPTASPMARSSGREEVPDDLPSIRDNHANNAAVTQYKPTNEPVSFEGEPMDELHQQKQAIRPPYDRWDDKEFDKWGEPIFPPGWDDWGPEPPWDGPDIHPPEPGGPNDPTVPPDVGVSDPNDPVIPPVEPKDPKDVVNDMLTDPSGFLDKNNLNQTYTEEDIYVRDEDGKIVEDENGNPVIRPDLDQDPNAHKLGDIGKLETALVGDVAQATASQGTAALAEAAGVDISEMEDIKAASYTASLIDPDSLTKAVDEIEKLDPMKAASMSDEMNKLLEGLEDGNVPTWARPAVAQVEQMLAGRGISASSIGRDSLFNAIIQSAMPIAQKDAEFKQDAYKTEYNAKVQGILTDVSNEFAAKQFNANSQNQAAQFNAQLQTQVNMQNAARKDAMMQLNAQMQQQTNLQNAQMQTNVSMQNAQLQTQVDMQNAAAQNQADQFNAGQANAMTQMQAQLQSQRDQFNSQMAAQIEQANVNWRRQINTQNTAGQNAVNQANVQNAFNLTNQALTFLWQEMRDEAQWDFQASEAEKDRKVQLEAQLLANETAMGGELGKTIEQIVNGTKLVSGFLDSWKK